MVKKNRNFYLKRAQIIGFICLILALIIFAINIIQGVKWYEYIIVITLIIAGLIFIYTSNKIRIKKINEPRKKS